METLKLTHRRDGDTLYFLPETWVRELKPHSKAKWTHQSGQRSVTRLYIKGTWGYELKQSKTLVVDPDRYVYIANLYMVIQEMDCPQARATITPEGLQIESLEGLRQRVLLYWQTKPTKTTEVLHMERN